MQRLFLVMLAGTLLVPGVFAQIIPIGPLPDSTTTLLLPGPVPIVPAPGLAGAFIRVQVMDPTEIDVDFILGGPGGGMPPVATSSPFGPRSSNTTLSRYFTTWFSAPIPTNSGVPTATQLNPFLFVVHVKNTGIPNNGDIDLRVAAGGIFHVPTGSNQPVGPGQFVWTAVTAPRSTITGPTSIPASMFFGAITQTFNYGVEHPAGVPEPASFALIGGGLLCLGLGAAFRRRRL